jgi:hypothetical protein
VTNHGQGRERNDPEHSSELDRLIADGRATAARGDLLEVMASLGLPAPYEGGVTPSEALTELRSEER